MFYLLHGNDEFTCREQLNQFRQQRNFDYNQDAYYGGEVGLMTLTSTCNSIPFLADQRLVILEGLPKRRRGEEASAATAESKETPAKSGKAKKSKKGSKNRSESRAGFEKGLVEDVPHMPETTVLIVLSDDELTSSSPLLKIAE